MRKIWQCLKTCLVVKTQERWVEARLLNIPQCTGWPHNKGFSGPNVSCAKAEKPWCRENTGVTGHSHEPWMGHGQKAPIVSTAFCSSSSITGHLAPIWKLLGLSATLGETAEPLQATESSDGCQPQLQESPGLSHSQSWCRKVSGWTVRQGEGSWSHYVLKKSFFRRKLKQPGICL